jgi:HipA N-terminal domain
MKRTIGVYFGAAGRRVGTLRFDGQGARQSAAFEYDRKWLTASDRFALEPNLPSVAGPQFHKPSSREASIFHGAIADTQPDGWARRVTLRDHASAALRLAMPDTRRTTNHSPPSTFSWRSMMSIALEGCGIKMRRGYSSVLKRMAVEPPRR